MTHEELSELYELYALGVLDPEERAELEEHLAGHCPQCEAGVRRALAMETLMATLPEPLEPPKRLRRRVLASVGLEPKTSRWMAGLAFVGACLLIGVVVLSLESTRRAEELSAARVQLRQSGADLARLQSMLELLEQPETQQVVFGQGQPQPPKGRVFVNAQRGVLLMASNLPTPPPGKTYEMWLVPKTGAPIPAGLFRSNQQGAAVFVRSGPVDVANTKAIAVTLEPEAGSNTPTMPLVIAAGLSD